MTSDQKLNFLQTFNAMRIFLSMYLDQKESSDLSIILSSLRLFKDSFDWRENPMTWDPAAWDDWMRGVYKTLNDLNIKKKPKDLLYDTELAFLCMKNYLQLFYEEIPYEVLSDILKCLDDRKRSWPIWEISVNHSINETYSLDESLNA